MNNQENILLVKKLFDEVYSKGDIELLDQVCARDIGLVVTASNYFQGGVESLKEREALYRKAFPNKTSRLDDIISSGDKVIVRWSTTGTHKGDLRDIQATGKHVKVSGISIFRIANNRIIEIDQSWDRLGLLEQLGVIEQEAAALHR